MIPKKTRKELIGEDESRRIAALDSIKRIDSEDLDLILRTAWAFDLNYLERVVRKIAEVKNEKSAFVISSILFASTEKSQEPIRIQCLEALSKNPTDAANHALINVAKNQTFYGTQCYAVKKLGLRKRNESVLALLHDIIEGGKYQPSTEESKQKPHELLLSAFEALSSASLRNENSALFILRKISDPSCQNIYREQGAKRLVEMGFDSLLDHVLDSIEEHISNSKVLFPLLGIIEGLKKSVKQKGRIQKVIEQILPSWNQDQPLNENLVALIKNIIDPNLVDTISTATCNWQLNRPAGTAITEILNTSPKSSVKTINALLRYADTGQWNTNKTYILENLNQCYLERPIDVIRKTFENDTANYVQCRNDLTVKRNTPETREAYVKNITKSIQSFVKQRQEDIQMVNRYLSHYFEELKKILLPLFKDTIRDEDWYLCTKKCIYPLINILSQTPTDKRESVDKALTNLIDAFLNISKTCNEFVKRASDDWLVSRFRTPSKYILTQGCKSDKHKGNIIETLIERASRYFYKGSSAARDEVQFQNWVSKNIISIWKEESRESLLIYLTKDNEFNEWVYERLYDHDFVDGYVIAKGLESRVSEPYAIRLLEDLIERYTDDAENILVQNINNGTTAQIRAAAAKSTGAIYDYKIKPQCPKIVLEALHERFTEQNREVRKAAYISLSRICSEQSIDPLLEAKSKDKKLEDIIRQSLDNIFARFSEARPSEDNVEATIAWIKLIGKLGDKRGFKLLKPYVDPASYHVSEAVRIATVQAMGIVGASDDIPFLEKLKETESHLPGLIKEADRGIGFISNIGDFELLDIMRQLTDEHSTFSEPTLDLTRIFDKKAQSIKNHSFQAFKAWNSQNHSLYVTHLDNVCDLISKRIMEVFRNELFQGDDKKYVSLKTSDKPDNRYNFLKGKFDSVVGSCFIVIHALRVKAPIAHAEDSKTEEPKRELSPEEGELARENFINAITRSVEMLKKKVFT